LTTDLAVILVLVLNEYLDYAAKKLHVITIYNNSKAVKKLCREEKLLLNIAA
jgi:hypothetical protein